MDIDIDIEGLDFPLSGMEMGTGAGAWVGVDLGAEVGAGVCGGEVGSTAGHIDSGGSSSELCSVRRWGTES